MEILFDYAITVDFKTVLLFFYRYLKKVLTVYWQKNYWYIYRSDGLYSFFTLDNRGNVFHKYCSAGITFYPNIFPYCIIFPDGLYSCFILDNQVNVCHKYHLAGIIFYPNIFHYYRITVCACSGIEKRDSTEK